MGNRRPVTESRRPSARSSRRPAARSTRTASGSWPTPTQRTLEPGFIYFVHIQALQRNSTLHAVRADGTRSDKRTYGAWEMIANTVQDRGDDFLVIWDEAHRGSYEHKTDRKTIAGTIVNGGPTNIGTAPARPPRSCLASRRPRSGSTPP